MLWAPQLSLLCSIFHIAPCHPISHPPIIVGGLKPESHKHCKTLVKNTAKCYSSIDSCGTETAGHQLTVIISQSSTSSSGGSGMD